MTPRIAAAMLVLAAAGTAAHSKSAPLKDPAFLNIGFVCHWEQRCIARQQSAMRRSLGYVKRNDPPNWKVQMCNRNASRRPGRVDWIGYYNCIRNPKLQRPSATASRR